MAANDISVSVYDIKRFFSVQNRFNGYKKVEKYFLRCIL